MLWRINESRRHRVAIKDEDKGSGLLISINMCLNVIVLLLFAFSGITRLPSWVFFLGIGVLSAGILLRLWSVAVLGRYFSGAIGVQEEQTVVDRGPYRLVRHPSYSGGLLQVIGLAFVSQTWGSLLVLIPLFGVVFSYRIHVEEEFLTSKLGDAYVAYSKRTKRLIPYIL